MWHRVLNTFPNTRTYALFWIRSEKDGIQNVVSWVSPEKLQNAMNNVFDMCYACLQEEENRFPVRALNLASKISWLTTIEWTKTV